MLVAWLYGWHCRLVPHFITDYNTVTTIRSIAIKFYTDVHGSQIMNSNDFSDPLTFAVALPAGQSFNLLNDISQHLFNGLVV